MVRSTHAWTLVALLCSSSVVRAQDVGGGIAVHGFGGWAYGRTNRNNYLAGLPEGDYRHSSMALNVAARLDEQFTIHTQAEVIENDAGSHVAVDYAFANYHVSDRLSFRIGKVKHPFGIYTEVFTVGTLRPFIDLPQGFYGPVGFASESYAGVGVFGTAGEGPWAIEYDLYGGGNKISKLAVAEEFYHGAALQEVVGGIELQSTRNVVGGRVVFRTPMHGLRVGASSYTGVLDEPAANRRSVVAAQLEYQSNTFAVQSEIAHENQVDDEVATGGYVQAAYRLTAKWQVAAQYNQLENRFFGVDPSVAPSLQFHKEGAVGLNYWVSRSLVIKSELHLVQGNRFATPNPELLVGIVQAGQLKKTTRLLQFGGQFSF